MEAQFVSTTKTNFGFKRLKKFNKIKPVTVIYSKPDKSSYKCTFNFLTSSLNKCIYFTSETTII